MCVWACVKGTGSQWATSAQRFSLLERNSRSQLLVDSQTLAAGQCAEIKEQKFLIESLSCFFMGGVPKAMGREYWGKEKKGVDWRGNWEGWRVGGKLRELLVFYLSSHFWLGYAPWGVRWAGWGWRPGADWLGRAWRCAGGCVGAGACAGVGETRPSGATRGLAVRRTAPCPALNSEPGNGCSAPASGGHAL